MSNNSYKSKGTGGRKQRRLNKKAYRKQQQLLKEQAEQQAKNFIPNINDINSIIDSRDNAMFNDPAYKAAYDNNQEILKRIEEYKGAASRGREEQDYKNWQQDNKNNQRAKDFKNAASKGRIENTYKMYESMFDETNEGIDNTINSLKNIIGESPDLKTAQKKVTEFGKKNGLDKANREELRKFIKHNSDSFVNASANVVEDTVEDTVEQTAKVVAEEAADDLSPSALKKIFNMNTIGFGVNAAFAVVDYKKSRQEGKGVIASTAKAGALFAAGELFQGAILPISVAASVPKIAMSALEGTQRMTRQMNNMQRIQVFGEASFQDTQQLATMRQSGMELAKMSQYNLQQSMMGNEAKYMHRL